MKIKDWEILSIVSGGIAFIGLLGTGSFAIFGQLLGTCFVAGLVVVMIRRGILGAKRKIRGKHEKKQAV